MSGTVDEIVLLIHKCSVDDLIEIKNKIEELLIEMGAIEDEESFEFMPDDSWKD